MTLNSAPTLRKRVQYVAERVPTDPFLDADPFCGWSHVLPQYRLPPKRLSPAMLAGGENPVLKLAVGAGFSPERERISLDGMDGHRFL
jgi:hypothetical protein